MGPVFIGERSRSKGKEDDVMVSSGKPGNVKPFEEVKPHVGLGSLKLNTFSLTDEQNLSLPHNCGAHSTYCLSSSSSQARASLH